MTLEELKQEISNRTGIPVTLLTGETAEENISRAKAMLAYRREHTAKQTAAQPKSAKQQFADWMRSSYGTEDQETETNILSDLENSLNIVPVLQDSGDILANNLQQSDGRSTAEQFGDWMNKQLGYSPF